MLGVGVWSLRRVSLVRILCAVFEDPSELDVIEEAASPDGRFLVHIINFLVGETVT